METTHKHHQQIIHRYIKNHATEVFCLGRLLDSHYIPNINIALYNIIGSTKDMMDSLMIDKNYDIDIIGLKLKLGKGYFNVPVGGEYSARCTFIAATSTTITSQIVVTSSDGDLVCLANVTGSIYRRSRAYPIPSAITSAIQNAHQDEIPNIVLASKQEYLYYRTATVVRPSEIGQNGYDIDTTNYVNYCLDGTRKAISTNSDYDAALGPRWVAKIRYLQSEIMRPVTWCQRITIHLRLYITDQILRCNIVDDQNNAMCVVLIKMDLGSSTAVNRIGRPKSKINIWQPNPLEIQVFSTGFGYYKDRYRHSDLGKLFRMMADLRVAAWLQGYMDWDQFYLSKGYSAVIASNTVKIKSSAHDLEKKTDVNVHLQLIAIRKSSLAIRHQLKLKTNPTNVLVEMITVIVLTRKGKPIPLPAQFMDKYAKLVRGHKMPNKVIPYTEKSTNTFSHVMLPRECEFDGNQHVNNAFFVTYCLDTACLAIQNRSSAYTYDYSDDITPQINQVDITYVSQVKRKDELIIETWQDASSNLNFDIRHARDGSTACRASFYLANVPSKQSKL